MSIQPIQVSIFDKKQAAPRLKESLGKKKHRFLIHQIPKGSAIAFSGKLYKSCPKNSCGWLKRRFVILHVHDAKSDKSYYLKANRLSLLKRLGMQRKEIKKLPKNFNYLKFIQDKIVKETPPKVEEVRPPEPPKAIEWNKTLKKVPVQVPDGEEQKKGNRETKKTGTLEYYSFYDLTKPNRKVKVDNDEDLFSPPDITYDVSKMEGRKIIKWGKEFITDISEDQFKKFSSTHSIPVITPEGKAKTFLKRHIENTTKSADGVPYQTFDDFLSPDIQIGNKTQFKNMPGNILYLFKEGEGIEELTTDYSKEEFDQLEIGSVIGTFTKEGYFKPIPVERRLSFNKEELLSKIEVKVNLQNPGFIHFYTFSEFVPEKKVDVFNSEGKKIQSVTFKDLQFVDYAHFGILVKFGNVNGVSDYLKADLQKMDPEKELTILVDGLPVKVARKQIILG